MFIGGLPDCFGPAYGASEQKAIPNIGHRHRRTTEDRNLSDLSVLAETPAILREVLDFIRHFDPGHFTSMTALATPQTDE
jgi:hypothetical protein